MDPTPRHVILTVLLSVLPYLHPRRLFSFIAVKDLLLSLSFRLSNLVPTSVPVQLPFRYSTSLHFWLPKSRTAKPPLLLIHGFGGNAKWQFTHQLRPLTSAFDLFVPDLLFFGGSTTTAPSRSIEFQAKCLVEAMKMLRVDKYYVVGISYGGYVAYRVAEMAGEGVVEKVVIMTAGVCAGEEERKEMVEREGRDVSEVLLPTKAEDLMELVRRSMFRPPRWLPAFILRDFIQVMYKDQRKERVELLKDLLSRGAGLNPLPVLKQETLILWGDQDNVFPINLAYKLQRHLGHMARLEVIKDAGHALQLEKPDIVNHMIQRFLLKSN